jgi:hypothetical protein
MLLVLTSLLHAKMRSTVRAVRMTKIAHVAVAHVQVMTNSLQLH